MCLKRQVFDAYLSSAKGYSADRVIADPQLNVRFIAACRDVGLTEAVEELNRTLLNIRKQGDLKTGASITRQKLKNVEEYRFAAEIAARHLEQKHRVALDRILCNPELASEFDAIAETMSPGFSSFEYRWAALQLRKSSKLKPELVVRIAGIKTADFGDVAKITTESLPTGQGIYILYSGHETLYVGEAINLRKRVAKHLEHSDRKALAEWLWENGASELRLEILELPSDFDTRARRAVERELIQTRRPRFNIQR